MFQTADEILDLARAHFRARVVQRRLAVEGAGRLAQPNARSLLVASESAAVAYPGGVSGLGCFRLDH